MKPAKINMLFEKIYKLLAVFAIMITIAPLAYFFVSLVFDKMPAFLTISGAIVFVALGYGLQALYGKALKIKRYRDSSGYEGAKLFHPTQAILPLLTGLLFAFFVKIGTDKIMLAEYFAGKRDSYDPQSVYPPLMMVFAALFILCGIILWFYPHQRVMSLRTFFSCMAAFLIIFILTRKNAAFTTFCFILFVLTAFVLLNQEYIIKNFENSTSQMILPSTRIYNMFMVILAFSGTLLVFVVIAAFITGITVIGKMLFFFFLRGLFQNPDEVYDVEEVATNFSNTAFGGIMGSSDTSTKLLFILFVVLVVGTLLYFIMARSDVFRKIFVAIKNFFDGLLEFLFNMKRVTRIDFQTPVAIDYRDEEQKITIPASVSTQTQFVVHTYKDFLRKLNTYKTNEEKVDYAYQTVVHELRELHYHLILSDTPREIAEKVVFKSGKKEIDQMTAVFEPYKYGKEPISKKQMEQAIEAACTILRLSDTMKN